MRKWWRKRVYQKGLSSTFSPSWISDQGHKSPVLISSACHQSLLEPHSHTHTHTTHTHTTHTHTHTHTHSRLFTSESLMNEPLARNLSRRTHPRKHPVHVESILSVDTVVFPSGSFVMEIMTQKMIHSHFSVVIQGSTMHKISIVGLSRFTCLSSNAQWEACTFLSKGITIRDIHSSDHQHALLSVSAFLSNITKIWPKKVKLTKNKIWMFFF